MPHLLVFCVVAISPSPSVEILKYNYALSIVNQRWAEHYSLTFLFSESYDAWLMSCHHIFMQDEEECLISSSMGLRRRARYFSVFAHCNSFRWLLCKLVSIFLIWSSVLHILQCFASNYDQIFDSVSVIVKKKPCLFRNLFVFLKARYTFEAHIVLVHFQIKIPRSHMGTLELTLSHWSQSYQLW